MSTETEAPASRAERITPADAEAAYSRATILLDAGNINKAVAEYERSAALRPRDYYLWLSLGEARDRANMEDGAIAAFDEAIRLAPRYAEPHWQLGNLLFRQGHREEGFSELRFAVKSDPSLLPNLIDLAWGATGGDAVAVAGIIQPQTDDEHLALARFFVRHAVAMPAIEQFGAASKVSAESRKSFVNDLLAIRKFEDAYAIWSLDRHGSERSKTVIDNAGFEDAGGFNGPGFGWQLPRDAGAVKAARDPAEPREGIYSLRVDWSGDTNPSIPAVSQLVVVEPRTRYRLRFSARTQELVTGGPPYIAIADVTSKEERILAQSAPLRAENSSWQDYTVDFSSGDSTVAITVSLRRQACGGRCPIFGHLWLDAFAIEKSS